MVQEPRPTEILRGTVIRLVYSAKDSAFRILEVQVEGSQQRESVLGDWAGARVGASIEAHGFWQKRKGSGSLQFRAAYLQELLPQDPSGLEAWLGSGAVKGIGKATAKKLVQRFGKDVVRVLDHNIERLAECKINKKQQERIVEGWAAAQATRMIMQFLRGIGIGPERSHSVWRKFEKVPWVQGSPAVLVSRLRDNPYLLIWVDGIGFTMADQAAGKLGLKADSPFRVDAGIQQVLKDRGGDGHVWTPERKLYSLAKQLLGVSDTLITESLARQQEENLLVNILSPSAEPLWSIRWPAHVERELARQIERFQGPTMRISMLFPEGFRPDPTQESALLSISFSRLAILAGGPGMGKTTLIKACVLSAQKAKLRVTLCAPTGRAAKRMEEATGVPASTIHRLIEYRGGTPKRNAQNPIQTDWLIVDEASMLDQEIAWRLLDAVPDNARVLFVGDPDQLPSVGQGSVLDDLIASESVTVARLTKIFRQGEGSGIPLLARAILQGQKTDLAGLPDCAFQDVDAYANEEDLTRAVVHRIMAECFEADAPVQVLSPMRNGPLGTKALNEALREAYNPDRKQPTWGRFRVGDYVIQTRNDYDRDIFNGDLGTVLRVEHGEDGPVMTVHFEGRGEVAFPRFDDARDLDFAWCLTVHKSQGGQFPAVALVATTAHYTMLKRNLLYTGITRAEKRLLLLSTPRALALARRESGIVERCTMLKAFLSRKLDRSQGAA